MSDPIANRLGRHVGEHRETARTIVVELPVTVTIEWPEGIQYSNDRAKQVACAAVSSRYGSDVGPIGKIVWAECSTECSEDDAEIIEGGDDYVSPEDQKRNDAMERGDYLRDRAKDEKQ